MSGYQLAQINIGRLTAPVTAPEISGFADNLDRINALAETMPGFVWRLRGKGNNATDIAAFDDPLMAINMSVWTDPTLLAAFVYRLRTGTSCANGLNGSRRSKCSNACGGCRKVTSLRLKRGLRGWKRCAGWDQRRKLSRSCGCFRHQAVPPFSLRYLIDARREESSFSEKKEAKRRLLFYSG